FSQKRLLELAQASMGNTAKLQPKKYVMQPEPLSVVQDSSAAAPSSPVDGDSLTAESKVAGDLQKVKTSTAVKKAYRHVEGRYDVTRIGMRGIGSGVNFYSIEKEEMLGRQLSQDIEKQVRLLKDPLIQDYVNRLGQTLVRNSDAQVPFTIKVVDDEEVNAFALPGGFFYVNTGLILAADNEAELAGVMAHEIAHVAARHATRTATKRQIWDLASLPLIFVGGPVTAAIRQFSSIAVPMSFLKFSRDAEREADLLGMEYEYAAGYDPQAFVDFFEKLQVRERRKKDNFLIKAFSTHPMTEDRIRRAELELETMLPPREDYIVTTSDFERVKAHLIQSTRGRAIDGGKTSLPTLRKRGQLKIDLGPPVLR
ncbi:MAG TPA: M48 family metallopeptidase, partial [Terriglobales bacterium]